MFSGEKTLHLTLKIPCAQGSLEREALGYHGSEIKQIIKVKMNGAIHQDDAKETCSISWFQKRKIKILD